MSDIWDVFTADPFMAASVILIVLPIQLLLCFYAKKILFRLLPLGIFSVIAIIFSVMMHATKGWESFVYCILAMYVEALIILCGFAWGLWAIINLVKKSRGILMK